MPRPIGCDLGSESHVLHLDRTELLDRVSDSAQEGRHVSLAGSLGVRLAEVLDRLRLGHG